MPQLENGYTRLADEIIEKVANTKLNGTQFRILLIVWRSTYGWQKKEHELSLGYLATATGIHKQQIKTALDKLIELDIVTVVEEHTDTSPRVLAFNKNYVETVRSVKKSTVSQLGYPTVSQLGYPTVSQLGYQNKDFNKELETAGGKQPKLVYDYYLLKHIVQHKKYTDNMSKSISKALDDYSVEELKKVIDRHKKIIDLTKGNGKYKVTKRGIDTLFSQKVSNITGSPFLFEEYLEGGAKYEKYLGNDENVVVDSIAGAIERDVYL